MGRARVERSVMWAPWDGPGLEHLRLTMNGDGALADGVILGLDGARPFRTRYRIACDGRWRVRSASIALLDEGGRWLDLRADGEGNWTSADGKALTHLEGCIDIGISATPFTNTLPIRRLGLAPGTSAELSIVGIEVPALTVRPGAHRYARRPNRREEACYLYENLLRGGSAELRVDGDGLVVEHPGAFRRVAPA